jgi:REP element-mobilizing transposase RayT
MAGKHLSLLVHFIWSTAQREPWIGNDWRQPLSAYVGCVIRNKNGKLLAAGGMHDHIHLHLFLQPFRSLTLSTRSSQIHRAGFTRRFGTDAHLPGRKDTARLALASHKDGTWLAISKHKNSTTRNVHAKRNILNFLADTELNTTSDTYGIDLCSPSGLNYILLSRSTT